MKSSHLGALLRYTRMARCFTQQDLAEHIGVTRQTIAAWERGDISDHAMPKICGFLQEAIDGLICKVHELRARHDTLESRHQKMRAQIHVCIHERNFPP